MSKKSSRRRNHILRRYRGLDWMVLLLLFAGLSYLLVRVMGPADSPDQADYMHHAKAIDGDSLVMNGKILRLAGIDAVEYNQTCTLKNKPYHCGKRAYQHLKRLLKQSQNQIKCILKTLDKYERRLAVCYSKTAGENSLSINAKMVRDGWAVAYGDYVALEREARNAKRGLWAGEFTEPETWRRAQK